MGLHEKCFILVGVGPLASAKTARWMRSSVPGVHIPDAVVERIEQAGAPRSRRREGKRLCIELIQQIREIQGVHGVHVMAYRQEEFVSGDHPGLGCAARAAPPGAAALQKMGEQGHDRDRRSARRPGRSSSASTGRSASSASGSTRPGARSSRPRWRLAISRRVERGHAGPGRGRRAHAGRQCGHPSGRRAGDPGQDYPARAVADRSAAVDRQLDRGRPGGGPRGLQRPAAGQLGDRRGGASGGRAAADQEVRLCGRGDLQRRDRDQRGPGRAVRGGEEDRPPCRRTMASSPRTSWSTRW